MLHISNNNIDSHEIEKKVYALQTLGTPRSGRVIAYWLIGIFVFFFLCLFLPWQQNVQGYGYVTAFAPKDRPQTIPSVIAGRIEKWYVQEGQKVSAGDTILVISEVKDEYFDPQLPERLQEQIKAKNEGIAATQTKINALEDNIEALQNGLKFKLQQAANKLQQARFKLQMDSADYEAEKINMQIARRQFQAGENMYNGQLISLVDFEKRKAKLQETQAKLIAYQNKVDVARNEIINAQIELSSIRADYAKEISKAQSDKSSAVSYLADAQGELSKQQNKYSSVQVRIKNRAVIAPQDGYVVKALKAGVGETLKEGDPVATIQPAKPAKAVELYVKAMDVPLLEKGRMVRLEFDGWPALQFSGWPSVSVGTFPGRVAVIDYVNSKDGKYRILVTPDNEEEEWPEQLRLGSGVSGFVMLNDVPVWYEIWRQLNGFPPSLQSPTAGAEDSVDKKKEGEKDAKK
ncbi:HlyD family secretion protein [Xanthocytophaga agilis]|uniref:HlyD family efflux transporter periplasmic adaptor subunit n=1 Tax=Xanthocytophaga agilis TaxID=3048010 RepID=A0AAE3R431_9BACT|nr:HlyD family efflux transporter periplasmic adaptor subunit [Xanthocytophaga agilis]MDJ1501040.1 HlyD family efflux transporter periplasmic adaptor subunit [Xanthocytophaga agilis]